MRVPLADPGRSVSFLDDEIQSAVADTIRSGVFLEGPNAREFSSAFAAFVGVPYCVPVANGSDALEIAIRSILASSPPGADEVITVANAGGYAVTACRQLGLTPVFADIETRSQLMDVAALDSCLSDRTALVVATHLYGGCVDIDRVRGVLSKAARDDIPIVEDCAQAHGAAWAGRQAGARGDVATFSFYPTKNLGALGDAGAILTSNSRIYSTVDRLRQYGWGSKYEIAIAGGRNSRMDEIQAAVLRRLLPHLDTMNAQRRAVLARYKGVATGGVEFVDPETTTVAHLAVALCDQRDRFRDHMSRLGVTTAVHYPVLDCDQEGWKGLPGRIGGFGLDASRQSVRQIVTLPCFPFMAEEEIDLVCQALAGWDRA